MSGNVSVTAQPVRLMPSTSPSVYANQLRVGVTVSDVTLTFGTMEDRGIGQVIHEDKVSVHLSPITAKILLENLTMIIDVYERVVGKIPTPQKVSAVNNAQIENLSKNLTDQMGPS